MIGLERTIILVKAWPQPSQKYGETVCCAGVTTEGEWRRLFPIRYRHLAGDAKFKRWDVITYRPERPSDDDRRESRRVDEGTLKNLHVMAPAQREGFFDALLRRSTSHAAGLGESLALVRPANLKLKWKPRSAAEIQADKAKRALALRQGSLLERELAQIEPCPFEIRASFEDEDGAHDMACSDWETGAAFFNLRKRLGDLGALRHLKDAYERNYRAAGGVVVALGTVKKRPQQWLLLGVIRLDETTQPLLI